GRPPPRELREDRAVDRLDELFDLAGPVRRDWAERAHSARVGALVAVLRPLVVLSGRKRKRVDSVAEGEDRDLLSLEQLLDEDRLAERPRRAKTRVELLLRVTDEDALACREPVGLQHARRTRDRQRPSCGHACGGHDLLGERLRALDSCRLRTRAENRDPATAKLVG